MTAGHDFERRLSADLHRELDALTGPHPSWADSPAAARTADRRGGIRWPGRFLAVAAVLALAGAIALLVGLRHEGVAGCPTLADYAAASAAPTLPPVGTAPGVSFPPVAPDATPTTGRLQSGEWAVISDADGPGIQMRIRDARECGRLPDYRSGYIGGSLLLMTEDIRSLRAGAFPYWISPRDYVGMGLAGVDYGVGSFEHYFGVPGFDIRTSVKAAADFRYSGDVVFDVPSTDAMVTADHPGVGGLSVGQEDVQQLTPTVTWIVRRGRETGGVTFDSLHKLTPGTTPSTGELALGTYATIADPAGNLALTITDVDQVTAYPGRTPRPGFVFVEGLLYAGFPEVRVTGRLRWVAVDGDGNELDILANANPNNSDAGVLQPLAPATVQVDYFQNGWLVVEAPPSGLIRLELWRDEQAGPLVSYVIRRP